MVEMYVQVAQITCKTLTGRRKGNDLRLIVIVRMIVVGGGHIRQSSAGIIVLRMISFPESSAVPKGVESAEIKSPSCLTLAVVLVLMRMRIRI